MRNYPAMLTNYSVVTGDCVAVGTSSIPIPLKSICFAVIKNALATASIRPHLSASPPDSADSSVVMM